MDAETAREITRRIDQVTVVVKIVTVLTFAAAIGVGFVLLVYAVSHGVQ